MEKKQHQKNLNKTVSSGKSFTVLAISIVFLIISTIFFYKYVIYARSIPIKKIHNSKRVTTMSKTRVVTIYIPNISFTQLTPLQVEIKKENFSADNISIFNEIKKKCSYLMKNNNHPLINKNVYLLNSYLVNNILYLNFSSSFKTNIQNKRQELFIIYMLVNTYTNLREVNKVKIIINNTEESKLKWYSLRNFYMKNLKI